MPRETLRIQNFAGISDAEIELNRVTVLIGPQASGKSVCVKLAFFFKEAIRRMIQGIEKELSKTQIRAEDRALFLRYFPPASWSEGPFSVSYDCGDFSISVRRKGPRASSVGVEHSKSYDELLRKGRFVHRKGLRLNLPPWESLTEIVLKAVSGSVAKEIDVVLANQNFFIPAGRSFFSTLESSVFSFIARNTGIDPFLAEFGRLYENLRRRAPVVVGGQRASRKLDDRVSRLICGTHVQVKSDDFIQMPDGRLVPVVNSSSGQQEALPLALTLASIARNPHLSERSTLVVEEPEAHLYPTAQREMVHLFAAATDLTSGNSATQYLITTHSPYVLSALNNLMYGGRIAREQPEKRKQVAKILGDDVLVDPANVAAYSVRDGTARPIVDPETGLVEASQIDRVSDQLAQEFEALMSVDFGAEAA